MNAMEARMEARRKEDKDEMKAMEAPMQSQYGVTTFIAVVAAFAALIHPPPEGHRRQAAYDRYNLTRAINRPYCAPARGLRTYTLTFDF